MTSPARRALRRVPLVLWLTAVWILLWGRLDPGTVLFGLLVALLISVLFPLPPVTTNMVVRPLALLRLIAYLAADLVVSTARVSWQALRHGPRTTAGIVSVTLLTDSDHLTAMVANAVSLAPGKFVLQIDRVRRTCYVYALGMRAGGEDAVRRDVLGLERRIVRAVGSARELEIVSRVARDAGIAEEGP
ncbi:Na+/H+ antiporter subunit E [Saccharopolyspora sp. MS10]|uniref:Na+/H+ antiporter subunit E n=1 Tax=Saccharopolyspora sp. MS10 TaxID=3385973 RepID=UPI0039A296F7